MNVSYKLVGSLAIILLLFLSIIPTSLSEEKDDEPWWDDSWSYRQRIILPINTSEEDSSYQPIDILFEFENSCWAENEKSHSIRVIYQFEGYFKELESQIYNLEYSDDTHIISCGLVFLIPENANGQEEYYVYYNGEETSDVDYVDRVKVEDSYFSYEPIRGIGVETWTYNIMQGENIIYSIAKEGKLIGDNVCQQVVKLKKGAKNLLPNQADHTVSYAFLYYWYENDKWDEMDTAEKLVSSEVSIDGNLMVKVGIISEDKKGKIRSTVFHKYYYCPRSDKSLYSNIKHEILTDPPSGEYAEGFFMNTINGVLKSNVIKELDYGQMPKYMHFYSESDHIKVHEFDPYPESIWERIIGEEDDYDLGNPPWISIDSGETGMAHGIVFDNLNVVSSGKDERQGIQIQLYQSNSPNLPGLKGRNSYLYIGRNSYEPDEEVDIILPEDYVVEFKCLYYSTENEGYKGVEKQVSLYHSLIDYQPSEEEEISEEVEAEEYNLTIYTHVPLNLILKKLGSNILLKNSYFHVELVRDGIVVGFEPAGKISFNNDYKIDWGNISFFRKAVFPHQKPGEYIAKVYLVNPVFGNKREFIGFGNVNLTEDKEIQIKCKSQGKLNLSFIDQNKEGLKAIETIILKDGFEIHRFTCNSKGNSSIGLPAGLTEKYTLKSYYKGFLIDEREISLSFLNNLFPIKKTLDFEVYDLKVEINNSSGKTPDFDIKMSLTSSNMERIVTIEPDRIEDGVYYFEKLIPDEYNLTVEYDSIKSTESITINSEEKLYLELHDLTVNLYDTWGFPADNNESLVFIKGINFDESFTIYAQKISGGKYKFSNLYPGQYTVFITYRSTDLKHNITIPALENKVTLDLPVEFNITTKVFDTHGNRLSDAKVIVIKEGKEILGSTGDKGIFVFSVPPGEYIVKILYENELVAQRKVDVLNDKTLTIVTIKEPLEPYLVIIVGIIFLIGAGLYSYKNKKLLFFLKVSAIILILISLISPWWSISGEKTDPHFETCTNLYTHPNCMVTLTKDTDFVAGDISIVEETFNLLVDVIVYLSIITVALVITNILLKRFTKFKKSSVFAMFLATCIMISSTIMFYFAASILSETTVGSLFGSGELSILLYGNNVFEQMICNWGLNIGFFLFLPSSIILLLLFLYNIKKSSKIEFICKIFRKGRNYK